jgi:hypothetical protein
VIPGHTGLFYPEQTVASLTNAILEFEKSTFDPDQIREHAQQFSRGRFIKEFKQFVEKKYEEFHEIHHSSRR